jgi:hypothetical protein
LWDLDASPLSPQLLAPPQPGDLRIAVQHYFEAGGASFVLINGANNTDELWRYVPTMGDARAVPWFGDPIVGLLEQFTMPVAP